MGMVSLTKAFGATPNTARRRRALPKMYDFSEKLSTVRKWSYGVLERWSVGDQALVAVFEAKPMEW